MSDGSDEEFTMEDSPAPEKKKPKLKLKIKADPDAVASSADAKPKKKKKDKEKDKKRKASEASGSAKKKVKTENGSAKPKKQLKELDKSQRLQFAMQSFLWWDAEEPPEGCQWGTMEHSGVSFPEPYVPHGIKMKYDGQEIDLTPEQEEA